uniref:Uncharacterized protein n=1 Tax=Meloidogyne javanica TaxID=6303 RepID=A0A915N4H2_MELJA
MRHHTMLHAQQNYNTNSMNQANFRQVRRPTVRESVVQPTANQNLNKKRVRFSEDTNNGKKRKGESSTENNSEMILDFENNSVNINNLNNSLDNQQDVVEDSTNISEPTEENP